MNYFDTVWYVEGLFRDKVDKGGNDYIDHLRAVSRSFNHDSKESIVALLHDTVEDTDTSEGELRKLFDKEIVDAVMLLTRIDMTYEEYMNRLIESNNIIALRVKKADLEDNMDLSRLNEITIKDVKRLEKRYIPSYYKVCNKLDELSKNNLKNSRQHI